MNFTGTRFEGDGRAMIAARPRDVIEGTRPLRVRRSAARRVVEIFEKHGQTNHSERGGTLWVVREWCRVRKIRAKLHLSLGFTMEKIT